MNSQQYPELVLGDLTITPYEYEEDVDSHNGFLTILGKALISEAEREQFREMLDGRYIEVTRLGVDESPLVMRIAGGDMWWSRHDEGVKQHFVLIDKAIDDVREKSTVLDPTSVGDLGQRVLRWRAAGTIAKLDALVGMLQDKGILTADDMKSLEERAKARQALACEEFVRLTDIDEKG